MKKFFIAVLISTFFIQGRATAQVSPTQATAATIVLEGVGVLTAPAWLVPALLTTAGLTAVAGLVYATCPGKNMQEKAAFVKRHTDFLIAQGVVVVACSSRILAQRFHTETSGESLPIRVEDDGTLVLGDDGFITIGPRSGISTIDPRRLKINGKKVNPSDWEAAVKKRNAITGRNDSALLEDFRGYSFSSPSKH